MKPIWVPFVQSRLDSRLPNRAFGTGLAINNLPDIDGFFRHLDQLPGHLQTLGKVDLHHRAAKLKRCSPSDSPGLQQNIPVSLPLFLSHSTPRARRIHNRQHNRATDHHRQPSLPQIKEPMVDKVPPIRVQSPLLGSRIRFSAQRRH